MYCTSIVIRVPRFIHIGETDVSKKKKPTFYPKTDPKTPENKKCLKQQVLHRFMRHFRFPWVGSDSQSPAGRRSHESCTSNYSPTPKSVFSVFYGRHLVFAFFMHISRCNSKTALPTAIKTYQPLGYLPWLP